MSNKVDQAMDIQNEALEKLLEAVEKVQAYRAFLLALPAGEDEQFADAYVDSTFENEQAVIDAAADLVGAARAVGDAFEADENEQITERREQLADDIRAGRIVKVNNPDGSATLYDGPYAEKKELS
jgi:hypothetical protein